MKTEFFPQRNKVAIFFSTAGFLLRRSRILVFSYARGPFLGADTSFSKLDPLSLLEPGHGIINLEARLSPVSTVSIEWRFPFSLLAGR